MESLRARLDNMGNKLANIKPEMIRIFMELIKENEGFIIDAVAHEQLFERGVNKLGVSISDYAPYSTETVRIKSMKGQPTDRVTLEDTREFKDSFYVSVDESGFELLARDGKTEKLLLKYGSGIMGLTEENLEELMQVYIKPEFIQRIKDYIND